MTPSVSYALVTTQPGATPEVNVYGPSTDSGSLNGAGTLLSNGASPPMTFVVVELQPAQWDSL